MKDKVKQRIQYLVPEVMEKFDVEKLAEKIHKIYCANFLEKKGEPYWTKGDYSLLDEKTKDYDRKIAAEYITLFGSPITLSVVLRAIEENIKRKWLESSHPQETLGNFQPWLESNGVSLLKEWNLKENYDGQLQPTKDFIGTLLGVE